MCLENLTNTNHTTEVVHVFLPNWVHDGMGWHLYWWPYLCNFVVGTLTPRCTQRTSYCILWHYYIERLATMFWMITNDETMLRQYSKMLELNICHFLQSHFTFNLHWKHETHYNSAQTSHLPLPSLLAKLHDPIWHIYRWTLPQYLLNNVLQNVTMMPGSCVKPK